MPPVKTILIHRVSQGFTGRHLKFKDYLDRADSVNWTRTTVYVDPSSSHDYLWRDHPGLVDTYNPENPDILFIDGTDWRTLNAYPDIDNHKTIINLIQHIRHAKPSHELYSYLSQKAVRICVSQQASIGVGW
jgi:hypothetical protein